jgi:hypothetical protein
MSTLKLYHGTVEAIAKRAPVYGLKPYTIARHPDEPRFCSKEEGCIALTSAYGAYQAFTVADPKKGERWAIVEVRPDKLLQQKLGAYGSLLKGGADWRQSLELSGLCGYQGAIPAAAIGKVWIYDPRSNWMITSTVLQTDLGVERFAADRAKLQVVTRWLTGDYVAVEEWLAEQEGQFGREQVAELGEIWHDRSGLDLFYQGVAKDDRPPLAVPSAGGGLVRAPGGGRRGRGANRRRRRGPGAAPAGRAGRRPAGDARPRPPRPGGMTLCPPSRPPRSPWTACTGVGPL